ncbi:acyl-CoA thioesterase [Streptomyces sp. NPDC056975]|uniref:acyl-CoA thioesterase n=1 Tax=Streptomyces sp. NPDC056975 TaxID=3345985 RepID=UPI003641E75B
MSTHAATTLDEPGVRRPSSVDVSLRWGDVDAYGHVNNCEIVRLLEEARMRWLMSTDAFDGETAVVAAHEIGYLRPLHYSLEPVRIEVWISNIRRSSFEFNFRIIDAAQEVSVKAVSRMVMFDLTAQEPYRINPALRAHLEQFSGDRL